VLSPRLAALQVLLAIERGHTTLAAELERAHSRIDDERDRALLVELTTGVLRWRAALDHLLSQRSKRPIAKLDPGVRAALRLGAYQLEHLDRIPAHAVLNEAVGLVRHLVGESATGFANAVLRSFQRDRATLQLPGNPGAGGARADQLRYLTIALSHPVWLVERWLDRWGFEATATWCEFNNHPPAVSVRPIAGVRRERLVEILRAAGVDATVSPIVPTALHLAPGTLGGIPPAIRDQFLVQDEGSQLVAHRVQAGAGESVLDLCASPGGKTMILREAVGENGVVIACDFRPARVELLKRMLVTRRVGASIVRLDAAAPLPFRAVFDRVLIDAPCSGLGTIRRDPDVKWSRKPEDLERFATEQLRMLVQAAEVVKPGGALVYATCSSEPDENEQVVARFLEARPDFAIDAEMRTLPFRDALDAYYVATLVRHRVA
jgi:16S rRNA (cytosine967-C5)-methyltransferase